MHYVKHGIAFCHHLSVASVSSMTGLRRRSSALVAMPCFTSCSSHLATVLMLKGHYASPAQLAC